MDTTARPLMIIFQRMWQSGHALEDWKKANITCVFKKVKKEHPAIQPHLNPWRGDEHLILEAISIYVEDKKLITSQHGLKKFKSCLTDLIPFYNETTTWMDDRRTVDVVDFDFRKAFDTASCILIGKLRRCGLRVIGERIVQWTENCLNDRSQRTVIRDTDSRPGINGAT